MAWNLELNYLLVSLCSQYDIMYKNELWDTIDKSLKIIVESPGPVTQKHSSPTVQCDRNPRA